MKSLLAEGWRFVPHSYSVVNQGHCLELAKIPAIRFKHRDLPPPPMLGWRSVKGLLSEKDQHTLDSLQPPASDETFDAVLRISAPYALKASPRAGRTFVFATAEFSVAEVAFFSSPLSTLEPGRLELFTPSNWSKAGLVNAGAREDLVHVIPHGFNPALYHPVQPALRDALRKAFGWEGRFVLLHVGSMTGNKGVPYILKAFAAIAARHPEALLVLKGLEMLYKSQDLLKSELARTLTQAEALLIADKIRYSGEAMPEEDLAALQQAADVYLSPYLAEGFNMPVLEAAACGLPSLCTAGGPTDDFTTPEFCLRIDSKKDVVAPGGKEGLRPSFDSLVAHLERVLEDHAWRTQASVAAAKHAHENYTWRKVVERLLDLMTPGWRLPE